MVEIVKFREGNGGVGRSLAIASSNSRLRAESYADCSRLFPKAEEIVMVVVALRSAWVLLVIGGLGDSTKGLFGINGLDLDPKAGKMPLVKELVVAVDLEVLGV